MHKTNREEAAPSEDASVKGVKRRTATIAELVKVESPGTPPRVHSQVGERKVRSVGFAFAAREIAVVVGKAPTVTPALKICFRREQPEAPRTHSIVKYKFEIA